MELEQLKQFVCIAQTGTLQAAARELHLSQSALSRSLRRLEESLGSPLFDRTRNSLTLNDAGRLALEHARSILAEEQRMHDAFASFAKRERTVRVASIAPAPTWRLSALVLESQPTTIIEPDIANERDVEARLLNGLCDFGITSCPTNIPTVRSHKLMEEDLYVNVPVGHALRGRSSVTFSELDGMSFLIYGGIGFWHGIHKRMLPFAQFVVQPDRTIFLQQVRTSKLLTFTTNAPENTSAHESRQAIPITDPEAHVEFYLGMRTDAPEHVRNLFLVVTNAVSMAPTA